MGCTSSKDVDSGIDGGAVAAEFLAKEAARKEAEEKEEAEKAKKAAEEKKRKEEEEAAAAAAAAAARAEEERIREERRNRPVTCSIVGPPGSIKGKVCELIVAEFGCKHVSLGEATRHAVQHETEAGRKVKEAKKEGQAITDEISVECIVELALSEDLSKKGYILDGIPRSTEQASAIADSGVAMNHLLIVEISDDELVRRAVGRRMDLETHTLYHLEGLGFPMPPDDEAVLARLTQRRDDTSDRVLARLDQYRETNLDVSPVFDQVLRLDGTKEPGDLMAEIKQFLKPDCD